MRLPLSIPFQATPSCILFLSGWYRLPCCQQICYRSPIVWTFVGSAVDVGLTFYTFIRGIQGKPRGLPLTQQSYPRHAAYSVLVAAGSLLAFSFLINSLRINSLQTKPPTNETVSVRAKAKLRFAF